MPSVSEIAHYVTHPAELRAIIQWKVWHEPVHERDESKESPEMRKCFYYLDFTSRSFASVIKELHPELLYAMTLFYLILRGLDTIEDDMTIPLETKEPILRGFDDILEKDGWNFDGNHSKEKDRDLLVEFNVVITEFAKIKEPYKVIIKDITKRMGNGMADYCVNAEHNENGVETIAEYEKYCHYVAGLVGEGCTRLFVEADLANPALLERPELMESMGQFLQQTNVIRDIKEDWDEKRRFWPKEIWSKYVNNFEDLMKPEFEAAAKNCNSEMIFNAMTRAEDCLYYLAGLREQSVFNFCAIPQVMAISTLDLCFRNGEMFKRNIKITKGQACINILESTGNLQMVCAAFKRYARSIHHKSVPQDPNYFNLSIVCGRVEQFIETIFPTQQAGGYPIGTKTPAQLAKEKDQKKEEVWEIAFIAMAAMASMIVCTAAMVFVAWMFGARFDTVYYTVKETLAQMLQGNFDTASKQVHNEL